MLELLQEVGSARQVPFSVLVKYVVICVRVCPQCHQSGGTDVVDLPDVLLPEDNYLYMLFRSSVFLVIVLMMNWLKRCPRVNTWLVSSYSVVWEALCFGSIRWCVWSFRPSTPLRLPHLKCLLCFVVNPSGMYCVVLPVSSAVLCRMPRFGVHCLPT